MMRIIALGVAAATGAFLLAGPAHAAGCNGHVNPAEWGCAPWDNNNGPQFPHYKKPPAQVQHAPAQVQQPRQPQPARTPPTVIGNQGGAGIVAQGGGNIVSQGGGNIVSQGGGNIVSQGGGNIVSQGGGNIVSQGGGNLRPGSHK
jgi:hypothetical protein